MKVSSSTYLISNMGKWEKSTMQTLALNFSVTFLSFLFIYYKKMYTVGRDFHMNFSLWLRWAKLHVAYLVYISFSVCLLLVS